MRPARRPRVFRLDCERRYIAANAIKASGSVRAAAYMAKMNDACVCAEPAGRTYSGLKSPAIENPLATRTFKAVIADARRMRVADAAVIPALLIDLSGTLDGCGITT